MLDPYYGSAGGQGLGQPPLGQPGLGGLGGSLSQQLSGSLGQGLGQHGLVGSLGPGGLNQTLGQPLGAGMGHSTAHGFPYYDDPGSPIADHQQMIGRDPLMRPATAAGGLLHNSREYGRGRAPLRSSYSLDRAAVTDAYGDPYMYRDRSLDRLDTMGTRSTLAASQRLRDRSLDRPFYSMRDDPTGLGQMGSMGLEGDYLRDPLRCQNVGTLDRSGYSQDGYILELQARLNEAQTKFNQVKRELDATTQKLGSSMQSIKSFWSPELKKERASRKEEAIKYAMLNDQLKILRSENQVCDRFKPFFCPGIYKYFSRNVETIGHCSTVGRRIANGSHA